MTIPKKSRSPAWTDAQSFSQHHFHEVRFEEGEKWLWNPAQKRKLRDRPEERVRLRCMEWLLHDCGVPMNRISTELPVKRTTAGDHDQFRADILAYDSAMKPFILVECKSEDVKLTQQTAMQAARYNLNIQAPYIILSNGHRELGFQIEGGGIKAVSPSLLHASPAPYRDASYWIRRGVLGQQIKADDAILQLIGSLYETEPHLLRYIKVPKPDAYPSLNHYYTTANDWSAGILAHSDGSTWLAGLHASRQYGNALVLLELGRTSGRDSCVVRAGGHQAIPTAVATSFRSRLLDSPADAPLLSNILFEILTQAV